MSQTRTANAVELPGAPVAEKVLADVARRAADLRARGVVPALATILVGDDSASAGYIRIKQKQAGELGFESPHTHLGADATQAELHAAIAAYNLAPFGDTVTGFAVMHARIGRKSGLPGASTLVRRSRSVT